MLTLISVTQHDIDAGEPRIPSACPVARAINRKLNDTSYAEVIGTYTVLMDRMDGYTRLNDLGIPHPDAVTNFIAEFDEHDHADLDPFTFTLDIPQEYLKHGGAR